MKRKSVSNTCPNNSNNNSASKSQSKKKRPIFINSQLTTSNESNDEHHSAKKIDIFFQPSNNTPHKPTLNTFINTPSSSQNQSKSILAYIKPINSSIYNFFNENDINCISQLFKETIIKQFKLTYDNVLTNNLYPFFNHSSIKYDKYIQMFFDNIIVKYILNTYDNLIYVPKCFMINQIDNINNKKHVLKLIGGYNETKKIKLLYEPINIEESKSVYPELTNHIIQYINKFKLNLRKRNKLQNALVLYKPGNDFIESVNIIEVICNDLGYQIIKLDELESQKYNKLNKIEEATKSKRLWTIDEDILSKLNIIEHTYKNNKTKWVSYIKKLNLTSLADNKEKNNDLDINNVSNISSQYVPMNDDNNGNNSVEYNAFKNFQNNINDITMNKRTLILIRDSFTPNDENNKEYLRSIISKIPKTKCPIIILTNNLSIFYTISPPFNICTFSFYKITNESYTNNSIIIYLISFVIYLHIYIKPSISNDIDIIIQEIDKHNKELQLENNDNNVYETIVKISFALCLKNSFNLDKILLELSFLLRKESKVLEPNDKVNNIKRNVCDNLINEEIYDNFDLNINNELQQLCDNYNEESYYDYEKGKTTQIINKRFKYLLKFKRKTTEDMNIEMLNYQQHSQSNYTLPPYILDDVKYKERLYGMKCFYHMCLSHNTWLTKEAVYEYNCLILFLLEKLSYEQIMNLFHLRRTRRNQHLGNDNENCSKINIIHKLFKYSTDDLFNAFLNSFNDDKLYIKSGINNKTKIVNEEYMIGFYKCNILYEKIKQNLLLYYDNYNKNNNGSNSKKRQYDSDDNEGICDDDNSEEN